MPETLCTIQSCELSEFVWDAFHMVFFQEKDLGNYCASRKRECTCMAYNSGKSLIMDKTKRITYFEYQLLFLFRQAKEPERSVESLCC